MNLKDICNEFKPDLIFLSEPQMLQCDLELMVTYLAGDYKSSLNSHDIYDPELPLISAKPKGGTMILWKLQHHPFITVFPVASTSYIPVIFDPPDLATTIHICVYFPTNGQDQSFIDDIALLSADLQSLRRSYPDASIC